MATKKVRWGVLGWARIARDQVIPAIERSTNAEFVALASRDETKLAEARAKFPGMMATHASYEALLSDPNVDAIYNPLPNSLHREWTLRAAAAGKHVLCEKPLGLSAAECREMIAACERHRVVLMEAFMYRYTARTRQVLEIVRSGALGDIRHIGATFRFLMANPASIKLQPELGGGSLYDVGCYPVNFTGMIVDALAGGAPGAGGQPESMVVQCLREGGIDMAFSAVLRYPGGLLATLHSGFNANLRAHAEISGTHGVLEIPQTFFDHDTPLVLINGTERKEIPVPASDRYRSEVEDFSDAILTGRTPQFSLVETLRNAEVMDRLFAAAR